MAKDKYEEENDDLNLDLDEFFPLDDNFDLDEGGDGSKPPKFTSYTKMLGKSIKTGIGATIDNFLPAAGDLIREVGFAKDAASSTISKKIDKGAEYIRKKSGGANVRDLAKQIGKELVTDLKYAAKSGDFTFGSNDMSLGDFGFDFDDEDNPIKQNTKIAEESIRTTKNATKVSVALHENSKKTQMKLHNASQIRDDYRHLQTVGYVANIDSNVTKITKFLGTIGTQSVAAQIEYYEKHLALQQDSIKLLNTIKNQTFTPSNRDESTHEGGLLSSIFGNGLDGEGWMSGVMGNIKDAFENSPLGSLMSAFSTMDEMKSSGPKKTAGNALMQSIFGAIPGLLLTGESKVKLDSLNELISTFPGMMNAKMNQMSTSSNNPLLRMIGSTLGIKEMSVKKVDLGVKDLDGKAMFDNRFYRTVTDAIPGLLSKILASVSGQNEIYYDLKTGSFKDSSQAVREYQYARDRVYNSSYKLNEVKSRLMVKADDLIRQKYPDASEEQLRNESRILRKDFDTIINNISSTNAAFDPASFATDKNYQKIISNGVVDPNSVLAFVKAFGDMNGGLHRDDKLAFASGTQEVRQNLGNFYKTELPDMIKGSSGGSIIANEVLDETVENAKNLMNWDRDRFENEDNEFAQKIHKARRLKEEEEIKMKYGGRVNTIKGVDPANIGKYADSGVINSPLQVMSNIYELLLGGILVYPRKGVPDHLVNKMNQYNEFKTKSIEERELKRLEEDVSNEELFKEYINQKRDSKDLHLSLFDSVGSLTGAKSRFRSFKDKVNTGVDSFTDISKDLIFEAIFGKSEAKNKDVKESIETEMYERAFNRSSDMVDSLSNLMVDKTLIDKDEDLIKKGPGKEFNTKDKKGLDKFKTLIKEKLYSLSQDMYGGEVDYDKITDMFFKDLFGKKLKDVKEETISTLTLPNLEQEDNANIIKQSPISKNQTTGSIDENLGSNKQIIASISDSIKKSISSPSIEIINYLKSIDGNVKDILAFSDISTEHIGTIKERMSSFSIEKLIGSKKDGLNISIDPIISAIDRLNDTNKHFFNKMFASGMIESIKRMDFSLSSIKFDMSGLSTGLTTSFDKLNSNLIDLTGNFKTFASGIINDIDIKSITPAVMKRINKSKGFFGNLADIVKSTPGKMYGVGKRGAGLGLDAAKYGVGLGLNTVKSIIPGIAKGISSIFATGLTGVKGVSSFIADGLRGGGKGLMPFLKGAGGGLGSILAGLGSGAKGLFSGAGRGLGGLFEGIGSGAKIAAQGLGTGASKFFTQIFKTSSPKEETGFEGGDIKRRPKLSVEDAINELLHEVTIIRTGLHTKEKGLITKFFDAGKELAGNIAGLPFGAVGSVVKGGLKSAKNMIKSPFEALKSDKDDKSTDEIREGSLKDQRKDEVEKIKLETEVQMRDSLIDIRNILNTMLKKGYGLSYSRKGKKAKEEDDGGGFLSTAAKVAGGALIAGGGALLGLGAERSIRGKHNLNKETGLYEHGSGMDIAKSYTNLYGNSKYGFDGSELTYGQKVSQSSSLTQLPQAGLVAKGMFKGGKKLFNVAADGVGMTTKIAEKVPGGGKLITKGKDALNAAKKGAGKKAGSIANILKNVPKFIMGIFDKILSSPLVKKFVSPKMANSVKNGLSKLLKPSIFKGPIMRNIGKRLVGLMGPAAIALSINDFISGMSSASRYFGLSAGAKPTLAMRLTSGVCNVLSSFLFGLIPTDVMVNVLFSFIGRQETKEYVENYKKFTAEKAKILGVPSGPLAEFETKNFWQRMFGSDKRDAGLLGFGNNEEGVEKFKRWRDEVYRPMEEMRSDISKNYGGADVTDKIPSSQEEKEAQESFRLQFLKAANSKIGKLKLRSPIKDADKDDVDTANEKIFNEDKSTTSASDFKNVKRTAMVATATAGAGASLISGKNKVNVDLNKDTIDDKSIKSNLSRVNDINKSIGLASAGKVAESMDDSSKILGDKSKPSKKQLDQKTNIENLRLSKDSEKESIGSPVIAAMNEVTNNINTELDALRAIYAEQNRHNRISERFFESAIQLMSVLVDNSKYGIDIDSSRNEILAKSLLADIDPEFRRKLGKKSAYEGVEEEKSWFGKMKDRFQTGVDNSFAPKREERQVVDPSTVSQIEPGPGRASSKDISSSNLDSGEASYTGNEIDISKFDYSSFDFDDDSMSKTTDNVTSLIEEYKKSQSASAGTVKNIGGINDFIRQKLFSNTATNELFQSNIPIIYKGKRIGLKSIFIPKANAEGVRSGDIIIESKFINGDIQYSVDNRPIESMNIDFSKSKFGSSSGETVLLNVNNSDSEDTGRTMVGNYAEVVSRGGR